MRFLEKIRLWWKFEDKYFFKDLKKGVKNLIDWFPIIWKDRDYSTEYIYLILKKKLELQSKGIKKRDIHVNSSRDSEKMETCVRLIEKLVDDFYSTEYTDYHNSDYWFEDIDDKPGFYSWNSEIKSENFDDYFKKYPLIYKRVLSGGGIFNLNQDGSEEEFKMGVAMNIGYINHERAKKILFSIIRDNIDGWWD